MKLLASLPDKERISHLRAPQWIDYKRITSLVEKLEGLLNHPNGNQSRFFAIVGAPNTGKTSMLKHLADLHPIDLNVSGDSHKIPLLISQTPPVPDIDRTFYKLLQKVNAPLSDDPKKFYARDQITSILRTCGVRLLIFDDFNNLLAGSSSEQAFFLDRLRQFTSALNVNVVVSGTQEMLQISGSDNYLLDPVTMPNMHLDDEFRKFLGVLERGLPLRRVSRLSQDCLANKIHALSGGRVGEIAGLVKRAATYAIGTGVEQITREVLDLVESRGSSFFTEPKLEIVSSESLPRLEAAPIPASMKVPKPSWMNGLWPVHPQPIDGELFSSWMVRVAAGNDVQVSSLANRAFSSNKQVWLVDEEVGIRARISAEIAERTGIELARVESTSLISFRKSISANSRDDDQRWILPGFDYSRRRKSFPVQYCPDCLTDDEIPYFRKYWRLGIYSFCHIHWCQLKDCCPNCQRGILLDMAGTWTKRNVAPLLYCPECNTDLRRARRIYLNQDAPGIEIHHSIAEGLAQESRLTLSPFALDRLYATCTRLMSSERSDNSWYRQLCQDLDVFQNGNRFGWTKIEYHRVDVRHHLLGLAFWIHHNKPDLPFRER